jgi:hypothetical protein
MLWIELEKRSYVRRAKVGNTRLMAVDVKHSIACTQEMARTGALFYAAGGRA